MNGRPVRRAVLDEPPQRVGVEVLLDQVAEHVEGPLADRREAGVRRDHEAVPAGQPRRLGQEPPAELVGLEGAVPVRAEDVARDARPPAGRRRSAAGVDGSPAGHVPVVDLVARGPARRQRRARDERPGSCARRT